MTPSSEASTPTAATTPTGPNPRPRRSWRATLLPWGLTALLLACAWAVNAVSLPFGSAEASFPNRTAVGQTATIRNLSLVVTDVHAARSITDATGWSADGTWLVVDVDAAAVESQYGSALAFAELTIGDRTFSATERGASLFRSGALVPGVMRHGSLAFELPSDALAGTAELRLANTLRVEDDGVIEVPIDLDGLAVQDSVTLAETGWTDR